MCYVIHDIYRDYRETLMMIIGMRFFIIAQHYLTGTKFDGDYHKSLPDPRFLVICNVLCTRTHAYTCVRTHTHTHTHKSILQLEVY